MHTDYCRDFLKGRCHRDHCKFVHGTPSTDRAPTLGHVNRPRPRKPRNTEVFTPMTRPVDMRIIVDTSKWALTNPVSSRDVLVFPNIFSDYSYNHLFNLLHTELYSSGVPEVDLLKLWHGNETVPGTHLIANDRTPWKSKCDTFKLVVDRLAAFFRMEVKATRFNLYTDTSQWKPFHFDAAAVDPKKAETQNFTVAVSFGATREAAFERADGHGTVVSIPQPDGWVYCFAKDINITWRHGILQELPVRDAPRISVILWGAIEIV
ncbi:hypothetical protein EB118_02155 [bacterium]|nr:hypothetical protein [bacterium]NDC93914.1 hypothetical protein [bacterium]NDD83253.1 hypothetical protein [bacterium]NDG28891.1 hypothetical protein [bacterium]